MTVLPLFLLPDRHRLDHERVERLASVEESELTPGQPAFEIGPRRLEGPGEPFAVARRCDHDGRVSRSEAPREKVRDDAVEELVLLVELNDVVVVARRRSFA